MNSDKGYHMGEHIDVDRCTKGTGGGDTRMEERPAHWKLTPFCLLFRALENGKSSSKEQSGVK